MFDVPVIVVSSPKSESGNTVLSLNLAGALWNDGYKVGFFSSNSESAEKFLSARNKFNLEHKTELTTPQIVKDFADISEFSAVIADISQADYKNFEHIFNMAHTLITPLNSKDDISWQFNDDYLNFIWKIKKNQAAHGRKYLNWIIVPYLKNKDAATFSAQLEEQGQRFGFRIAPEIYYRDEYMHVADGFCSADLIAPSLAASMTLADVYARREILKLTDHIWQKK